MNSSSYVVAGGSSGIGLEITRRLVHSGSDVVVLSRTIGPLADLPGVSHTAIDLTRDAIERERLPERIKGLVYCPGSIRLRPFHRLTTDDFENDWQVNVMGAVKTVQACLPGLKKAQSPASVVLFSTVAVATGMPFHASIASAKGAIEGLTRSLAAELAPTVRVNAVAPSLTDTPLAGTLLSNDSKRQSAGERHPLKRVGTVDDVAASAIFLLDDSAAWITGQVLSVDGGMGAVRTFK